MEQFFTAHQWSWRKVISSVVYVCQSVILSVHKGRGCPHVAIPHNAIGHLKIQEPVPPSPNSPSTKHVQTYSTEMNSCYIDQFVKKNTKSDCYHRRKFVRRYHDQLLLSFLLFLPQSSYLLNVSSRTSARPHSRNQDYLCKQKQITIRPRDYEFPQWCVIGDS